MRRRCVKSDVKSHSLTVIGHSKLAGSRSGEETGIADVAVKCVEISKNTGGEGESLDNS